MVDVAIIGAGLMGRWHLATARSLGARVVAIVDPDLKAAETLRKYAPDAQLGIDLSLVRDRSAKVAHICTPTETHAETAIGLAEGGIHALIEKPLASTMATTRQVLDAALRGGVQVCPVHQYAFQPGVERARSAIGALGPIHRIDFNICSAGADDRAIAPDELVNEIIPHPISILQRIVPAARVADLNWTVLRPKPGEIFATATHDGLLISVFISAHARPTCMATHIQCRLGSIEINGFHGYAVIHSGRVSRSAKIGAPFFMSMRTLAAASYNLASRTLRQEPAYSGLRRLTSLFYASIASEGRLPPPIDSAAILEGAAVRDLFTAANVDPSRRRAP